MGQLKQSAEIIAVDGEGAPADKARLYVYGAGSDNLVPLYLDPELTHLRENPLIADAQGRFDICHAMDGTYRIRICDKRGAVLQEIGGVEVSRMGEQGFARSFAAPADMLADKTMAYAAQPGRVQVRPGQLIKSVSGGFVYEIAPEGEARPHLTTAGGVNLFCRPTQPGEITLRQVGGQQGTDITDHLQHAIMVASFGNDGHPIAGGVLIDVDEATLSSSVHVHYGHDLSGTPEFRGIRLRGLGKPYARGRQNMGTRLICTMTDRPAFVVQSGRFTSISDLSLIGAASDALETLDDAGMDIRSETGWDAALVAAGVTPGLRYAPHAAIAIDPYSGPVPAQPYPGWSLHGWIGGAPTQYGQGGGSSRTTLRDLAIEGWEVGIVQQPGDASANSDFLTLHEVDFRYVKYADSTGSSQSRNTLRDRCGYSRVWCLTTNHRHGQAIGTASGSFNNCSGAGFIGMFFDMNGLSYGGGLAFNEFDVEGLWRIGHVENANTGETDIRFRTCQIGFSHAEADIHPGNLITGASSGGFRFEGCNFQGFASVLAAVNMPNVTMAESALQPQAARARDYQRLAHNLLAGGFVPYLIGVRNQAIRFVPQKVGGGTAGMQVLDSDFHHTGRDWCLPLVAGATTYAGRYLERLQMQKRRGMYNSRKVGTHFTVTEITGRTVRVDLGAQFSNEQNVMQSGYLPGDVAVHEASGTVMFIRSADDSGAGTNRYSGGTGEVILEMQNNHAFADGAYAPLDGSFLAAGEKWIFLPSRIYAPEVPLLGDIGTGSADIAVRTPAGGFAAGYGLVPGDYYWEDQDSYATFPSTGRARIVAVDSGAGTITMGGTASQALGAHPFAFWCRMPPANAAER